MLEANSPDMLVMCDGEVWLLFRQLPDLAVCMVLPDPGDGVLRIVVDPSKPDAMAHVLHMLAENCHEPITIGQLPRPHLN
jgi:hypothetical protein